jgi:hypothetical protein
LIEIKRSDNFFYVVAKLVPVVSFGDDAVGQTFRNKATVGFLSDFENQFAHSSKVKVESLGGQVANWQWGLEYDWSKE